MSALFAVGFWAYVLTVAGIFAVFVLGLQLEVGDTGLLNFGHVAFMAIGAYATGLMVTNGFPLLVAVPIAVLLAGIAGALIGIPTLRLRGDYFAIVTIAAGEILRILIQNRQDETGGTLGLSNASGSWPEANTAILDALGNSVDRRVPLLVLTWLVAVVIAMFLSYLGRSPWRRALRAVRENEDAAAAAGKPVFRLKIQSLAIGAAIAGLSGVLFTLLQTSLYPENFEPIVTFTGFAILILGGIGSYFGVIVGAIVISFIYSGVRFLDFPIDADKIAALRFVVIGLIIMAVMAFRPAGLFGKKEELHLDG